MIFNKLSKKTTLSEAYNLIKPYIHKTPVLTSVTLNNIAGKSLYLKCENFQRIGAFKIRGAIHAIMKLKQEKTNVKAVVTHSSGNHAQAIALAAKLFGLQAHIGNCELILY